MDIDEENISPKALNHPMVLSIISSSTHPALGVRVKNLREECPGPVFPILDSDHEKNHVRNEMLMLRDVLAAGDYLVVEDGIVNGNPILPEFGEGPLEALRAYQRRYPDDYRRDLFREEKFGITFAPEGFLIRV